MNIERPTSNGEWKKNMKYYNDILEEPEELTKIFVTSIKTVVRQAVRQAHGPEQSRRAEKK